MRNVSDESDETDESDVTCVTDESDVTYVTDANDIRDEADLCSSIVPRSARELDALVLTSIIYRP